MAKLTTSQKSFSQQPLSKRFFDYNFFRKATFFKAILLSLIAAILVFPIVSSVQKSLSFSPFPQGVPVAGSVVEVSDSLKDYPKFKPYDSYKGYTYVVPKLKYSVGDKSFLINADEPAPVDFVRLDKKDDGTFVDKPVKLLVDAKDPSIAIVNEYPTVFNWMLIVGVSLGVIFVAVIAFFQWKGALRVYRNNRSHGKKPKNK